MKSFEVIKKNRKYFAATQGGYPCKILIDSNSESLELGTQDLEVEDISVRTKYGTDLIFKLSADIKVQKEVGICTLKAEKNELLIERAKNLGGKWDSEAGAWVFSALVADKVEELDELFNSPKIGVELHFKSHVSAQPHLTAYGYILATAFGRDSGAKIGANVAFVEGKPTSGGSMKNWTCVIPEGCVVRLMVPKALVEEELGAWPEKFVDVVLL